MVINSNLENKTEIARLLIKNNANVNFVNASGETALYKAVMEGNMTLIKYLSSHGAEICVDGAQDPLVLAHTKLEEAQLEYKEASRSFWAESDKRIPEQLADYSKNLRTLAIYAGNNPGGYKPPTADQAARARAAINMSPAMDKSFFNSVEDKENQKKQWEKVVKVIENAAHPSILKQAKKAVVGAFSKVSLVNSPSTSSAASSSKTRKEQKGSSR